MKSKPSILTDNERPITPTKLIGQIPAGSLKEVWYLAQKVLDSGSVSRRSLELLSSRVNWLIRTYYRKKQVYNICPDYRIWQSVEELKVFLGRVRNPKYRLIFSILAWTGIRQSELFKAEFDFKSETMYIHTSKSNGEILPKPLPSKLCKELQQYLQFYSLKTTTNNLRIYFKKVLKQLGGGYTKFYGKSINDRSLFYFSVHSFRKWFATLIDSNGFGHFAINDTRAIAEKHYIGRIERIRKIINELY